MGELGLSLSQARLARGLSLEDAERSTRISKRFLLALEANDYSVFPAPVYARGFLRTYCRFLDLDPEQQLTELPLAWTQTPTLPSVSRPLEIKPGWLAIGLLGAFLVFVVVVYGLSNDKLSFNPSDQGSGGPEGSGSAPAQTLAGRPIADTPQGVVPDFVGVALTDVLAFLADRRLSYLVVEATVDSMAEGLVVGQSPSMGARAQAGEIVTLTVSARGASAAPVRTDCAALAATSFRTNAEQQWFQGNCTGSPATLPDRTSCDAIRGTDYRSTPERQFFLANCISTP